MAIWIAGAVAEIDQLRGNDPFWRAVLTACGYDEAAQVDVLVGASAGGLNGVLMAQTIHTGQRFADTLELWHERAGLDDLVKGPRHAVRSPRDPEADRSAHVVGGAVHSAQPRRRAADVDPREVLDGEYFRTAVREVLDHLRATQTAPAPTHDLAVFASATLVAPNPVVYRDVPGAPISEATSEAYFHVAKRGGAHLGLDGFVPDDTVESNESALAGIGRATSSLPGLFAPVTFRRGEFGPRLVGAFRRRDEAIEVMDGGVIDNVPISRAIRAIYQSRASRRVRRVLVYLHPDPGVPKPVRGDRISTSAREVIAAFIGKSGETLREDIDLLRAHNASVERRTAEAEALLATLASAVDTGRVTPPPATTDAASAIVPTVVLDAAGAVDSADPTAPAGSTDQTDSADRTSTARPVPGATPTSVEARGASRDEFDVVSSALGQIGTVGQLMRVALAPDAEMQWHAASRPRVVALLDAPDDLDRPADTRARFAAAVAERPDVLVAERGRRVARALTIVLHQGQRANPAADFRAALAQLDELVLLCDLLNAYQFAQLLERDPASTPTDRLTRSATELERLIASSPGVPPIERLATWNVPPIGDGVSAERLAADRGAVDALLGARVAAIVASLPALTGDSAPERILRQLADGALSAGNVALVLLPLLIEPVASDQSITFVRAAGDVVTDASRAFMGERQDETVKRLGHRLAGKQLHHLGAFFAKSWRINDTRWGQLDAVPALIEAIVDAEGFARLRDSGSTIVPADVIAAGADATKRYLIRRRQGQLLAHFTGAPAGPAGREASLRTPTPTPGADGADVVPTDVVPTDTGTTDTGTTDAATVADGTAPPAEDRAIFDPALAAAEGQADTTTADELPGDDEQFERAVASPAFAEWRTNDRRIVSLLGTRDLTSMTVRMSLTAVKVLGHGLGLRWRLALHAARPLVLVLGGLVLAGRWMAATLAWTLCVMAAPRIASPLGARVMYGIGVAAVLGTVWLLARYIKPIRRRWLLPYALAVAGVLVGLWFAVRMPAATDSIPVLGDGWPWKLVMIAAVCSAVALFFWMHPVALVVVLALLAAWYGVVSYVGYRASIGEPVFGRATPWWASHLLLAWVVAVVVMAWALGQLPDRWLRPRAVRSPTTPIAREHDPDGR